MKVKVNGYDIECTPAEFRELVSVRKVVSQHKDRKKRKVVRKPNSYRRWAKAEDDVLRMTLSTARKARMLKRSRQAVKSRMAVLKSKGER